jgi:site-specific DNA recombinase
MNATTTVRIMDLYCRMSQGDDGTLFKCEDQERQGRAYVAEHAHEGWVVGKVLYDHALSGWKRNVIRPSFNQIMDRLESGESHGVWVRDLTRFTRKLPEALRIKQAVDAGGVVAAGYSEYDLSTVRGLRAFYDDAVDAELESQRISERTRAGMRNKALRGRALSTVRGFARPGYLPNGKGWEAGDPRTFVPAEQLTREVQAVRDATTRILAGEPMSDICQEWNDAKLLTVKGGKWDTGVLRQMLTSPALAGLLTYKGEVVGRLDGEPVLDLATRERLLLSFSSRKRGRPAKAYLLSGIVTCEACGAKLYGRPKGTRTYNDGSPTRQYWCQVRPNSTTTGCGKVSMDQREADRVVEALVVKRLGDPRHADRITRVAARVEKAQTVILKELSHLNTEVDDLLSKKPDAVWTMDRINVKMAQYAELIEDAQTRLLTLGEVPTAGDALEDAQADWDAADEAERRTLVKRAYPEGLTIRVATNGTRRNRIIPTGTYPGTYRSAA